MYSFVPHADLSTSHTGFWVVLGITLFIAYIFYEEILESPWAWLPLALPTAFAGYASFLSSQYIPPANTVTYATFSGYVPAGGKSSTMYGRFTLEDGSNVLMEVNNGAAIPPTVVMYRR